MGTTDQRHSSRKWPPGNLAALVRRERYTRFAGGAMGSLWAYTTPIAWIVLVVVSFQLLGRVTPLAVGTEIFVATGILPYILFRQTITSMMRTLIANRYLLYFQPLSGQDILLAAAVVELLNMMITAVVIFAGITLVFGAQKPANLLEVYFAMGLAWAMGASAGSFFAALGQWSDSLARVIPLVLRPLFWISGIFYIATELPVPAQNVLWWNPLFHVIESLREGYFLGYISPVANQWYVCVVIVALYLASVLIDRFVRRTRRARYRI